MSKFVVIEGSDASGKQTQTEKLVKNLALHNDVECFSFPVYESPTGNIIKKYLSGEFGDPSIIDPKIASIWYAENRYEYKYEIEKAILNNKTIICDRYVGSNMGHQGAKISDPIKRLQFFKWLEILEYENFSMPRPNINIFLHMPWHISIELIARREITDKHEKDENHLKMAEQVYLQLAKLYDWIIIECCNDSGKLKSVDEISCEIYNSLL